MKKDGGPAFARPTGSPEIFGSCAQDGMSMRDYFAGQALSGCIQLMLTSATAATARPDAKETVAAWAYEIADEMIAEREKD